MNEKSNTTKQNMEVTKEPLEATGRTNSQATVASTSAMGSQLVNLIDDVYKLSSNEAIDIVRLQEGQEKLKHAGRTLQSLRKKMAATEKEAFALRTALEKETAINECLKSKSESALQLTESFNQHINYINDTMTSTKQSAKELEDLYENKIAKLLNNKKKLSKQYDELRQAHTDEDENYMNEVEQVQSEITKTKADNAALDDELRKLNEGTRQANEELAKSDKVIENMKIFQDELKNKVEELRNSLDEERNKRLFIMNNFPETDKIKETKQYYEKELSLAHEELNKNKSILNKMQEEQKELLQKYEESEKCGEDLDKNIEKMKLQEAQLNAQIEKAKLELQQVNEQNDNTRKTIDQKMQDLSTLNDKLASETQEKNELATKINSVKEAIQTLDEENKNFEEKLKETDTRLAEIEQWQTNANQDLKECQTTEEPKVVELKKKLNFLKEREEKLLAENQELKADQQLLEKDHKKNVQAQTDQYNACISDLEKQKTLNARLVAELSETQNSIHNLETGSKNLEEKITKDKKDTESKIKKVQELLNKSIDSEKQLMEERNQIESKITELEEECKKIEETCDNVTTMQKTQSNIESRVQTPVKKTRTLSQTQTKPTKDEKKIETLKLSPVPGTLAKSPRGKPIINLSSSDSDDDIKNQSNNDRVDALLESLRISPLSPSNSLTSPSPGTPKRN